MAMSVVLFAGNWGLKALILTKTLPCLQVQAGKAVSQNKLGPNLKGMMVKLVLGVYTHTFFLCY